MMMNTAAVPRVIADRYGCAPPSYYTVYRLVVDAKVRAQRSGGRWFVDPADVARALGLTRQAGQPAGEPASLAA